MARKVSTAVRLAGALDNPDPWTPLHELAMDPPGDLVAVIRATYAAAGVSSQRRRLLAWLLVNLRDEAADSLVPELLSDAGGADADALLRTAVRRRVTIAAVELVRLLAVGTARQAAIDAA
ncbi:MAG TPA: hypothetical protein VFB61_16480 [Gemmatimonadales bacterium]|nr:hypothetical protein [Gemmatimonadales bacterium]